MKELIEYIARSLASNPDAVRVTETVEDGRVILRLEVAPEDKGKVIGRQGRVAKEILAFETTWKVLLPADRSATK